MRGIAFDIETTGLDPKTDRVTAVSLCDGTSATVLYSESWREKRAAETNLLERAHAAIAAYSGPKYTWNGDGFDIPFLAERFKQHRIPSLLIATPTGSKSKYDTPLFHGIWNGACIDIAPAWRAWAEEKGIKWSLKPVAESVGLHPVVIEAPQNAAQSDLLPYAISDALITYELARIKMNEVALGR